MNVQHSHIDRLLNALQRKPVDRVPNFEIIVDNRSTRKLLGMPAEGSSVTSWTVAPQDAVRLARMTGQDAIVCSLTWMAEEGSIESRADADAIVIPDPVDARGSMQACLDAIQGTNLGVVARLTGPLTLTYMAMGPVPIESFMMWLYDDLELVEHLMDMFVDYHLRLIDAISDMPYHLYYIGDDVSSSTGPMISPHHLAELWAPRARRLVQAAKATGKPIIFHCCGMQAPILPYLVKWGVNAVHPIQPVANDIYRMKADWGEHLTLIGNIDAAGVLTSGTPDEVRAEVREHIDRLANDGGYVVCSSHSIVDSIPPENYLAMCDEAARYTPNSACTSELTS